MKRRCFLLISSAILLLPSCSTSDMPKEFARYGRLVEEERWEEVIASCPAVPRSHYELNCLNLALAETGRLGDELFKYRQHGPLSLVNADQDHQTSPLTARILFSMGDIAAAQMVAFNASMTGDRGYDPAMLRILAQAEIMRGCYASAEKYLARLERMPRHRRWARERRRLLYDDAAVEADPELSRGRLALGTDPDRFALTYGIMDDLERIIGANPSDSRAMQYALCYLLLAKDFCSAQEFVARHYGSEGLRTLPVSAQEAVIFFSDYFHTMDEGYARQLGIGHERFVRHLSVDREWCRTHGVTDATLARFDEFKKTYGKAGGGSAPDAAMYRFRDTFWYYLLYANIQ